MNESADRSLSENTALWAQRAERILENPPKETLGVLELVREGILLRRRWDALAPDEPLRRGILQSLPSLQSLARDQLAEGSQDAPRREILACFVQRQLREDDDYLVSLLDRQGQAPEAAGFAIESFRDDLHWLGTQAAILDGARDIDFLGGILLEQEAIERNLDDWEDETAVISRRRASVGDLPSATCIEQLRPQAARLRTAALVKQLAALAEQPEPQDAPGWYRRWMASSRLAMRLSDGAAVSTAARADSSPGKLPDAAVAELLRLRRAAADGWRQSLETDPNLSGNLHAASTELADSTNESLTFLEDLPLPEAVRTLEVLEEDLAHCLMAVERLGGARAGPSRRRLRRRLAAVAGELQERRLDYRLESLFGRRLVAGWERFVLFLLLLFCAVLVVEGPLLRYERAHWLTSPAAIDSSDESMLVGSTVFEIFLAWFDLGICAVFLTDFLLKMAFAQRRWLYFRRNWLTGLVPSIPLGFFAYATRHLALAQRADWIVALRALRYLRLPRMARWLRIARPLIRVVRLMGFVLRASDRLARQMAPLLNRNLLLFERAAIEVDQPEYRVLLSALRERFYGRAIETLRWLPRSTCERLAQWRLDDLLAMLSATRVGLDIPGPVGGGGNSREIPFESVVARLLATTPAGISDRMGRTVAHSVARWCRAFDLFGIRSLPLARDLVGASRLPDPYETAAAVANRVGLLLNQLMDRVHWFADLYGTVTAPQLVDSIGDYMVRGAARPAKRLVLISLLFFFVSYLGHVFPLPSGFSEAIQRLLALPLLVLGGICIIVLLIGLWFRQIAGQATDFFNRVAEAQFLSATVQLKRRLAERQREEFDARVLQPERQIPGRCDEWPELSARAAELLWNDFLQGAPFHGSDTKTTTQLLGNLALLSLRENRLQYSKRRRKQVDRLDLASPRMSLQGPYLWFRFISRSLAQQTAKLVENYNSYALPLARAATAEDWEIRRYVDWLSGRWRIPREQLRLAGPFRDRLVAMDGRPDPLGERPRNVGRWYQGTDFTAIHFLSADKSLEDQVRRRYGDAVADLLHRDRRDNVRRVFQTYPWHQMPPERRTINPYALYMRLFSGGRVLVFPIKVIIWGAMLILRALRLFGRFIREVLEPSVEDFSILENPDPFAVARRKIHRMRRPLFMECLRMRAQFDPEYLGILIPSVSLQVGEAARVQIEDDLARIGAAPSVFQEFREASNRCRRQMLGFCEWFKQFGVDGISPEGVRAMAIAYAIDHRGVRSQLETARRIRRAFDTAIEGGPETLHGVKAARHPSRWRQGATWRRLFAMEIFGDLDASAQAVCLQTAVRRRGTLLKDIRRLTARKLADPAADARAILYQVGRDPRPWSHQLLAIRAVQTLSVLDLRIYDDLVAELGDYADAIPRN